MEKIYDMAIISDRLSYGCQKLEWEKKEAARKAEEEAKAKAEAKAKEEAKAAKKTTKK